MTYPAAPETMYLLQPQRPPSASHIDWRCGAENIQGYHCHDPTDAERRHDDVSRLILQLLIQPTSKHLQRLIQCVRKEFEDWWKLLLPCSQWQQQPPGRLRWSCPTWFDCSLEETVELRVDSGKKWSISKCKNRTHYFCHGEWTWDDLPIVIWIL